MPEREAFSHRIARTWQWCREGSNIRFTNGRRGQPPLAGGKANSGRPAWLSWARSGNGWDLPHHELPDFLLSCGTVNRSRLSGDLVILYPQAVTSEVQLDRGVVPPCGPLPVGVSLQGGRPCR